MKSLRTVILFGTLVSSPLLAGSNCGAEGDWRSGIVPDQWGNAKFYKACEKHDDCYGTYGSSKHQCDKDFMRRLNKECERNHPTPDCFAMARVYFESVDRMGGDAFDKAQRHPRSNRDPMKHQGYYTLESGTVLFSNGQNAFCSFVSPEHFATHGSPWSEAHRNVISKDRLVGLSDHGVCPVTLEKGFFMIEGKPEVFWSNGENAYCHVPSWSVIGETVRTYGWDVRGTANFRFDGGCRYHIDLGFFRVQGDNHVYFSNGSDAYCWVPHSRYLTQPVRIYDFDIHSHTPLRKDGKCPGME